MTKGFMPTSVLQTTLASNVGCEAAAVSTAFAGILAFKVCVDAKGLGHLKSNIHTSTSC